jgi:hypothetical protein
MQHIVPVLDASTVCELSPRGNAGYRAHLVDQFRRLGFCQVLMEVVRTMSRSHRVLRYDAWAPVIGSSPLTQSSGSFSVFERVLVFGLSMANLLE